MTRVQRARSPGRWNVVLTPLAEVVTETLNTREKAALRKAIEELELRGRSTTTKLVGKYEPYRVMYARELTLDVVFCQECETRGFVVGCQDCALHTRNMIKVLNIRR